jgi:hypothetical protein
MYKIKIPCTNRFQLNYHNKLIRTKISDEISDSLLLTENVSIERMSIVYKMFPKKNYVFTTISLEILSREKFTLQQVQNIIKNMRNNGFYSKENVPVQFIETNTNKILYVIGFQNGTQNTIPVYGHNKNISKYFTKNMWIRQT